MSEQPVLSIRTLARRFGAGEQELIVLDDIDLDVRPGEIVGLVGPSGSGKSSLLHAAGLLEEPSSGEVSLAGVRGWELSDSERTALRGASIGFVYQFHHLLPELSALENAALPSEIAGRSRVESEGEAQRLLKSLGLGARLSHRPSQLSGGEQQRVAIARALVNRPLLILADEPTGNLDPDTATAVFEALAKLVRDERTAALVATHNYELVRFMDRVVGLSHGKLVELDPTLPIETQLGQAPKSDTSREWVAPKRLYPWARFWAKQVDVALYVTVFSVLTNGAALLGGSVVASWLTSSLGIALVWLAMVVCYPLVDAFVVSRSGGSPGRALFRFSVGAKSGTRPAFRTALARAWTCLFFGQGVWIFWPFAYWLSYSNLVQHKASLWDRDSGTKVVHRGPRWWSWIGPLAILALGCWEFWQWGQAVADRLQAS